ncbi:MAG: hypothetical protein LBQ79_10110 [Deltaproteobacteria bacterium]|jgi:tetratricopeptide (TPR) repeat protein|nr:hypothetical protein [Deltaproteobacteria bacterium]
MSLRFAFTQESGATGAFRPEDASALRRAKGETDRLAAGLYRHELTAGACAEASGAILAVDPLRLDALSLYLDARLAERRGRGRGEFARDVAARMGPLLRLIGGFRGALDPEDELSIHFLSCHNALIAATVNAGKYPEALAMCRRHAEWDARNPDDARAYVGNLLLILGKLDEAEEFFVTPPVPMPYESAYGEALLRFLQGRHAESAQVLRRAFISQPYVAEIVLRRARGPVPAWNLPDGRALFYSAMSYADAFLGSRIWQEGGGEAALFLSWAYNSPGMMMERARALSILAGPGPGATPAETAAARDEFFRFSTAPNPRLARTLSDPVAIGGADVLPWLASEVRETGDAARATKPPPEGFRSGNGRSGPGAAGRGARDAASAPSSGSGTASASGAASPSASASSSRASGGSGNPAARTAGTCGARFAAPPPTADAPPSGTGSGPPPPYASGASGPRGASGAPWASGTSGTSGDPDRAVPGQDRRLRPVSGELAAAEDMPADSDWIFASRHPEDDGPGACGDVPGKAPAAASGSGRRPAADGWEPWSPPDPPHGETPGGGDGEEEADEEPDCGDCEGCASFDECSKSPEYPEEECDECSECEIEGFCRPVPVPPKDPPFRH